MNWKFEIETACGYILIDVDFEVETIEDYDGNISDIFTCDVITEMKCKKHILDINKMSDENIEKIYHAIEYYLENIEPEQRDRNNYMGMDI